MGWFGKRVAGAFGAVAELSLVVAGAACLLWWFFGVREARVYATMALPKTSVQPGGNASFPNDLYARLEIPALNFIAPVVDGTDAVSLRRGVGHIAGTAEPGGLGNVGLAGHRDTIFRPLRNLRKRMVIRLTNNDGIYSYVVDKFEIVSPESTGVLGIASVPELTLVTCYPFDFIGSAPRRFVVHAHLQSVAASSRK